MNKKKQNNKFILILIATFFILIFFNTFHNAYVIKRNNYEMRLAKNYGYCDKQGYGFVSSTINKNNIEENIHIINNFDSLASINGLFYNFNKNYNENYLILLNNENIESSIVINNIVYEILDNFNNRCFLVKKKND